MRELDRIVIIEEGYEMWTTSRTPPVLSPRPPGEGRTRQGLRLKAPTRGGDGSPSQGTDRLARKEASHTGGLVA